MINSISSKLLLSITSLIVCLLALSALPTDVSAQEQSMENCTTVYSVELLDKGRRRNATRRTIAQLLGVSRRAANRVLRNVPATIVVNATQEESWQAAAALESVGASVNVQESQDCQDESFETEDFCTGVSYAVQLNRAGRPQRRFLRGAERVTNLSSAELREKIDAGLPAVITEGLESEEAELQVLLLDALGARVEILQTGSCAAESPDGGNQEGGDEEENEAPVCEGATYVVELLGGPSDLQGVVSVLVDTLNIPANTARVLAGSSPVVVFTSIAPEAARFAATSLEGAGASVDVKIECPRADEPEEEEELPEMCADVSYVVHLRAHQGRKLAVTRAVKLALGIGLREAKAIVDATPSIVSITQSAAEASRVLELLVASGAEAEIVQDGDCTPAPGADEVPEAPCDSVLFHVRLLDEGTSRTTVITELQELLNIGVNAAEDLLDRAPLSVFSNASPALAETAANALRGAGATVSIEQEGDCSENSEEEHVSMCEGVSYSVVLERTGGSKLAVVKVIKTALGIGLRAAKDLADAAPTTLVSGLESSEQALVIAQSLAAVGATTRIDQSGECADAGDFETPVCDDVQYTVQLVDHNGVKLNVTKAVKRLTGLGLKDSKDLVDAVPSMIVSTSSREEAWNAANALEESGATVAVLEETSCQEPAAPEGVDLCEDVMFQAVITRVGGSKLSVVKAIKSALGLGLRDAKDLADNAPSVLITSDDANAVQSVADLVSATGATVEISQINECS